MVGTMNVAADPIVHAARVNAFQPEATWRLGPDALERTSGEPADAKRDSARFPYAAIQDLGVCYDPTRFDRARHRCDLRLSDGRTATFYSTHYVSFGEFEDRAATYVPLVRGLIARVAAANPACRFRSGKRPLVYWAEHVFLLAMVALLVSVLALVGGAGLSDLVLVKLGIILGFIPLMIMYTRKNWPRRFDPAAIPADALPGG
jgi:hypothetical protein